LKIEIPTPKAFEVDITHDLKMIKIRNLRPMGTESFGRSRSVIPKQIFTDVEQKKRSKTPKHTRPDSGTTRPGTSFITEQIYQQDMNIQALIDSVAHQKLDCVVSRPPSSSKTPVSLVKFDNAKK
jgi:hypothetical protein